MYCKLCGEHLYKDLSFDILFKLNYDIHTECEDKINKNSEYLTIPFLDKLLLFGYLFEEKFDESDSDYLYDKYSKLLFDRMLKNNNWSICIIIDRKISYEDIVLVTKLASSNILFLSIHYEDLFQE